MGIKRILSVEQIRQQDAYTLERVGVPLAALMENAGRAVAEETRQLLEEQGPAAVGVLVFCGGGHNGGDGLVAARHLHQAGLEVEVFLVGSPRGEAARQAEICRALGLPVSDGSRVEAGQLRRRAGLIIDALFGTGLDRPVQGVYAAAIAAINQSGLPVLAVDIPSGLHGDSGAVLGQAVRAQRTVTFGFLKQGFFQGQGADHCGEISLVDISLAGSPELSAVQCFLSDEESLRGFLPRRRRTSHKGTHGRVYLLCGSPAYSGAAVLCAQAAQRSGAGLVEVGLDRKTHPLVKKRLLEAVSDPLPDLEGVAAPIMAERLRQKMEKASAVAIGCGLSRPQLWRPVLEALLPRLPGALLLDADGLNALGKEARRLLRKCHGPVVITPHPGEFSRISGASPAEIAGRRLELASRFALESGAVVLLKGTYSVIASPEGVLWVNASGNPGLAKGGSGDILAGLIAGYLAQGMEPVLAARAAAFIHGAAADLTAEQVGEAALLAGDLLGPMVAVQKSLAG